MYDYLRDLLVTAFSVSDEIAPDKSLGDLGVDSLTTADICSTLEDDLKVSIGDREVNEDTTVGELADLLRNKGAVPSR